MGTKLKYYKDKVKTKVDMAGHVYSSVTFPFEREFYDSLKPKVFVVEDGLDEQAREVVEHIKRYWEEACIAEEFDSSLLHDRYRGIYGSESIVENKEISLYQIGIGKSAKQTHVITIQLRSCNVVCDAAFVVFEKSSEYTQKAENILIRDNGVYCQTWVRDEKGWSLLGESIASEYDDFG